MAAVACGTREPADEVRAAFGSRRMIQPRLSGPWQHAPCTIVTSQGRLLPQARCAELPAPGSPEFKRLDDVTRRLRGGQDEAEEAPPAPADPARGLWDLLWSSRYPRDLDRAVGELRQAAGRDPASRNLLAAGYYVRAQENDDPLDLLRALDLLAQLRQEQPDVPEAVFNYALTLQALYLDPQAQAAWEDYLQLDSTSAWASEARDHLAALAERDAPQPDAWDPAVVEAAEAAGDSDELRRFVDLHRGQARTWLLDGDLMQGWAAAAAGGDEAEATRRLQVASAVAAALSDLTGDPFFNQALAGTAAATGSQRTQLIAAWRDHVAGMGKIYPPLGEERDVEAGYGLLVAAEGGFTAAGNVMAAWDRLQEDTVWLLLANSPEVAARLSSQLAAARPAGWTFLIADLERLIGHFHLKNMDLLAARDLSASSLASFEALGERTRTEKMQQQLGEILDYLEDDAEGWRLRLRALSGRDIASVQYRSLLTEIALRLGQLELPFAGLVFLDEAVASARETGPSDEQGSAYLRRSRMLCRLGRQSEADSDLASAEALIGQLPPADVQRFQGELALARAEVQALNDPSAALESLDLALKSYADRPLSVLLTRLQRAAVALDLGDETAAERELDAVLEQFEQVRKQREWSWPGSREGQIRYFEQARGVLEELMALASRRGDAEAGLGYAERLKARVLLEQALSTASAEEAERATAVKPLAPADLQAALPPEVVVLNYAVLPEELLVWRVRAAGIELFRVDVRAEALEEQVAQLRAAIEAGKGKAQRHARALHQLLIEPLRDALPAGATLVLVPDRALHQLPFSLLQAQNGRLLLEDHPLVVAPSISFYVTAEQRRQALEPESWSSALVVGNPTGDLAFAEQEARAVAELYGPRVELLLGPQATQARVLAALATSPALVHIAAHGVAYPERPLASALRLAPTDPGQEVEELTAAELSNLRLPGTRLVVLAGCETAGGATATTEGILNLARPFLAAGVPTVLATLWQVEDQATAELLRGFHQRLQAGKTVPEALREVQLESWSRSRGDWGGVGKWAGFEVVGSW